MIQVAVHIIVSLTYFCDAGIPRGSVADRRAQEEMYRCLAEIRQELPGRTSFFPVFDIAGTRY